MRDKFESFYDGPHTQLAADNNGKFVHMISKVVGSPHLLGRELNRIWYRMRYTEGYKNGIRVFEKDWDNLIILDACRFDKFRTHNDNLPGSLNFVKSQASTTTGFIKSNIEGTTYDDTVCVSGNAWYAKLRNKDDPWFYRFFNENNQSPNPLAEKALNVAEKYPNKRIFIHFLPPHTPYIGSTADIHLPKYDKQHGILPKFRDLNISDSVLHDMYEENLERVIPHVRRLLTELEGKTVVTADHGELLGDRLSPIPLKDYGHYKDLYVEELVKVPWLEYQNGERKEIESGTPKRSPHRLKEKEVDQRLEQLGYKL